MASFQGLVAVTYLFLPRLLDATLSFHRLPTETRTLFGRHCVLIAVIVTGCAVLTWRFAAQFARGASVVGRWLAGAIGSFWIVRALQQLDSLLHCDRLMLLPNLALATVWFAMAVVYFVVASRETETERT